MCGHPIDLKAQATTSKVTLVVLNVGGKTYQKDRKNGFTKNHGLVQESFNSIALAMVDNGVAAVMFWAIDIYILPH